MWRHTHVSHVCMCMEGQTRQKTCRILACLPLRTHYYVNVCTCTRVTCVTLPLNDLYISTSFYVMLNVFPWWLFLGFVWLTPFMSDNKVWIEPMHFALKYYSIWIWLNERVNEWMDEWRSVLSAERGVNFMNDHCAAARNKNGSSNFLLTTVFILFLLYDQLLFCMIF